MFSGARIEGLARVDATKTVSEAVQHEEALTAVNIPVLPLALSTVIAFSMPPGDRQRLTFKTDGRAYERIRSL